MHRSYTYASALLLVLTRLLLLCGVAAFIYILWQGKVLFYLVWDWYHYQISVPWIIGWSLYAALITFSGQCYCHERAKPDGGHPGDVPAVFLGKIAIVIGLVTLFLLILKPTVIH